MRNKINLTNKKIKLFLIQEISPLGAKNSSCQIILCSATPSLETNYNSLINRFHKVSLTKRINAIPLPEIKVVDMRSQKKIISDEIEKSIEENFKTKCSNNNLY